MTGWIRLTMGLGCTVLLAVSSEAFAVTGDDPVQGDRINSYL
jgi:hypothetical protein